MLVDILMATYNGERYVENQLLSLIQQTHKSWRLFVRDDGSSDQTLEIVNKYANFDKRIILLRSSNNSSVKKGAAPNFLELTKISGSSLVMFCDQDDIWFEKKIETMVSFASVNFNEEIPCLAYCDAYGYADDLGEISIDGISKFHANHLKDFIFFNAGYQGCSLIINKRLCECLSSYKGVNYHMHDDIATIFAYTFGRVFRVDKKLMLYRQHDKNVTGNIKKNRFLEFRKNKLISSNHYREKEEFFQIMKEEMSFSKVMIFDGFLNFYRKNIFEKFYYIIRNKISYGGSYMKIYLKVILQK